MKSDFSYWRSPEAIKQSKVASEWLFKCMPLEKRLRFNWRTDSDVKGYEVYEYTLHIWMPRNHSSYQFFWSSIRGWTYWTNRDQYQKCSQDFVVSILMF